MGSYENQYTLVTFYMIQYQMDQRKWGLRQRPSTRPNSTSKHPHGALCSPVPLSRTHEAACCLLSQKDLHVHVHVSSARPFSRLCSSPLNELGSTRCLLKSVWTICRPGCSEHPVHVCTADNLTWFCTDHCQSLQTAIHMLRVKLDFPSLIRKPQLFNRTIKIATPSWARTLLGALIKRSSK